MDPDAAARARRAAFKRDLTQAYTDDEACVPEWVDLMAAIDDGIPELHERVEAAVDAFVAEPDIRLALAGRDRAKRSLEAAAEAINSQVRRLNFIAPHPRFHRAPIDPDAIVRPLYTTDRRP